ncbi:MAG: pilus assembly protein [Chloroflexi bacterium]|nr:MAG: pilus assembly protein [Chloroflexota bacterium]
MTMRGQIRSRLGAAGPAVPRARLAARRDHGRGQALVEFVAVLLPLLLIVVAIVQFGLLFGANVSLTNAAREGARAGTIYLYDRNHTKAWNDGQRCAAAMTAATQAFGLLTNASPYFSVTTTSGACTTNTGETQVNGDLTVAYCASMPTSTSPCPNTVDPTTTCAPDTREGCLMQVSVTYRSDIIVPLIGQLLSRDTNGRFVQKITATMVVN